jgi:proteic killer suppression protein
MKTLYESGQSKKYLLDQQVVRGFFEVITAIDAAQDIYDLQKRPSLNFERLKGTKSRYSLRINRKYRLEVDIDWDNDDKTVGIVGIEEISKHYE